jgi:hypothetical protein
MVHKIQKNLFEPKHEEESNSLGFELFFVIIPGLAVMALFSAVLLFKYFKFF